MGKMILNGTEYSGSAEVTFANGLFIDADNVVCDTFTFDSTEHTWTATEDCILTDNLIPLDSSTACYIKIDGKQVSASYVLIDPFVYVGKGQVVAYRAKSGSSMKAYGVQPASNVTFIPDYASACYSTQEREVGCWVDGKPLYQRTFIYDTAQSYGSVVFSTGLTDVEEVASFEGVASYQSSGVNNKWLPFVFSNDSNGTGTSNAILKINSFLKTTGEIYAYIGEDYQSTYAINRIRITLRYTKTTDVAGSGNWTPLGKPTVHYSTEEQVIGTWIDGKPIYQITVDKSSNPVTINTDWAIIVNIPNIKRIIHSTVLCNKMEIKAVEVNIDNSSNVLVERVGVNSGDTRQLTELTIQYTKTTD